MKIAKQSAQLLWITPCALQMIEAAGRTAYKSEDKITGVSAAQFVKSILARGHESVVEHASASIRFVCDRGVSHELVRHRLFSFTQESTRYCNYGAAKFGNEITVIQPPLPLIGPQEAWQKAMEAVEMAYLELLDRDVLPQLARSVLPNSLKTEIVTTGNFREWRHFFRLRTSKAAHPQMQELARMALDIFRSKVPEIVADI